MSINEWWKEVHQNNNVNYLSGSEPVGVLKRLEVFNRIRPKLRVLVIGVGFGYKVSYLRGRKVEVHALDICTEALERVKKKAARTYLTSGIENLPVGYFDLVVSHLVAQHVSDSDLSHQLSYIIKSMNVNGILAIQFANLAENVDGKINRDVYQTEDYQMKGGVVRSPDQFASLFDGVGKMVWLSNPIQCGINNRTMWYYAHVKQTGEEVKHV